MDQKQVKNGPEAVANFADQSLYSCLQHFGIQVQMCSPFDETKYRPIVYWAFARAIGPTLALKRLWRSTTSYVHMYGRARSALPRKKHR